MDKSLILLLIPLFWLALIMGIVLLHVFKRRQLTIDLKGFGIEVHVKSRRDYTKQGGANG